MISQQKLKAIVAFAAAAVLFSTQGWAGNRDATISGVVTDAAGKPVSGAFVKLHNADRSLRFMVITQTAGRYTSAHMPTGDYTVQAVGGDYQSKMSATVHATSDGSATMDVALTDKRGPTLPNAWPGMPPGVEAGEGGMQPTPTMPAGAGKRIMEARCTVCHSLGQAVTARPEKQWPARISDMREYMQGSNVAKDLTDAEAKTVLAYLQKNFSSDKKHGNGKEVDPNSRLPRTLMRGIEARYTAVEFTLPVPNSGPHEMTLDPRGDAWVTERGSNGLLGHFGLHTLKYTRIAMPPGPSERRHLNGIVNGKGNMVWFVDGGANRRWYSMNTKTLALTTYPLPPLARGYTSGNTMRVHPDGSVWLNAISNNQVLRLEPSTREFTVYNVPSGVKAGTTASPYGMGIDGYGNIWFVENKFNKLGRLDPTTGHIDEYDIPVKDSTPRKMGMDAEGNIWVGLHGAGKLLKVDYRTLKMTVYSPPTKSAGVYSIWADYKHDLIWFSEQEADQIGCFNPRTETFLEFSLASAESDDRRIQVDENNPNRIWWSGNLSNKVGYIELHDWQPN